MRWPTCALLGALLVPCAAFAGVLMPKEPGAKPLRVRSEHIQVRVKDQVARATVGEVFENLSGHALEGEYLLPLPKGAAISGFATWVHGKRVDAHVAEKAHAKAMYEAAQGTRAQPALLVQHGPDTFATRVDGIPARGTKRIEARFARILPYTDGEVTLRIPLAVKGVQGTESVGDFRVGIDVRDSKRITDVRSPTPGARVVRLGARHFRVLVRARNVQPPSELLVTYRTESKKLGLSFATYKPDGAKEGYFLLLASPKELTTRADIVKKDIVFVFDVSGSMSGTKIDQARAALKRCLGFLQPGDRFGILAFSDAVNPFKNHLLPASAANVHGAMAFADGLAAEGGTDIQDALEDGLKMLGHGERPKVIVFMTDGVPTDGETRPQVIAASIHADNGTHARIFSFGVGSDVNRVLLEKLGRENRGAVAYVQDGAAIDKVIGGFYAKISRPELSDLSFDFGNVTTALRYPNPLPDLYKGTQLVVVGKYRGSGTVKAHLSGTLNGKTVVFPFTVHFPKTATQDAFVARLWAEKRIDALLAQIRMFGERPEEKNEVISLAKRYDLVTPYTSMVAVKKGPEVASLYPERVQPGDPTLHVRAPREATVRIRIPAFHLDRRARWDSTAGDWTARFLIPPGTEDGTYPVHVEIALAGGKRVTRTLHVSVDTHAPAIAVSAASTHPGGESLLHAQAELGPLEVIRTIVRRSDPMEAVKALVDIRAVTAHLWNGRDVPLRLDSNGLGFSAEVETRRNLPPGRYPVTFTARDFAGNISFARAVVEVTR